MRLALALAALAAAMPAFAQYAGPAILSRGEGPVAMSAPQIAFRPFFEFSSIYDTGLAGVSVDPQGTLGNTASLGVQLSYGVSGAHSWTHTKLSLDYRGSFSHFTKTTYYDGTDQSLMLGLTHALTRRMALTLRESAGLFSRNTGLAGLSSTVPFDPSMSNIPTTDFFDNRTMFASTQADLSIQKSARLSFSLGGSGSIVRYRSSALYGLNNTGARADMQYRLSRRSTVGAAYNFTHYRYTGVVSVTDLHSFTGTYSIRLSRTLEFSAFGGVMRSETSFQQLVPLDPVIAILIGRSAALVENYNLQYLPTFSGRLSQTFRRGVAYISASHTVTPGNGLFLTSIGTGYSGGYSYTGLRFWSLNAQTGYFSAQTTINVTGNYGSVNGGLSASRQIGRNIHAVTNFNVRQYRSPDFNQYNRRIYTLKFGLGFTPGDVPLRIW